jgi:hypothetical protein
VQHAVDRGIVPPFLDQGAGIGGGGAVASEQPSDRAVAQTGTTWARYIALFEIKGGLSRPTVIRITCLQGIIA